MVKSSASSFRAGSLNINGSRISGIPVAVRAKFATFITPVGLEGFFFN
jgi:hypothetical protein